MLDAEKEGGAPCQRAGVLNANEGRCSMPMRRRGCLMPRRGRCSMPTGAECEGGGYSIPVGWECSMLTREVLKTKEERVVNAIEEGAPC